MNSTWKIAVGVTTLSALGLGVVAANAVEPNVESLNLTERRSVAAASTGWDVSSKVPAATTTAPSVSAFNRATLDTPLAQVAGELSAQSVQTAQSVVSAQTIQTAQSVDSAQSPASVQSVQSPASVQSVQSPASVQSVQSVQSPASVQSVQSPNSVDSVD